MGFIAVIDIETNWDNEMMSIGAVIADDRDYRCVDSIYMVIDPCYKVRGMFSDRLFYKVKDNNIKCKRENAIQGLNEWFREYGVDSLFAYNASFDKNHIPEFGKYKWYDIMKIAAYKQYNRKITCGIECYRTGKMKRDYGVESMMRMLSGDFYSETHNALQDALDELKIMELLGLGIEIYQNAQV